MMRLVMLMCLCGICSMVNATDRLMLDSGAVEYEVRKGGDVVVFFEAGAVSGMAGWNAVWNQLPSDITAVRYSRVGEGSSDRCDGQRQAKHYVSDAKQLLNLLNIHQPVIYVSHSLGGIIARQFAVTHPERVSAMLMLDPANERDVEIVTQIDPVNGPKEIAETKRRDYALAATQWCFVDMIWEKQPSFSFPEIQDIPITLIATIKVPSSPQNLFETAEGRKLWGQFQQDWVESFPRGKAVLTQKSGHFIQDDEPQLVINELIELLAAIKKPQSVR
ncbi:alpha/beta fold hydrolase [Thaumasiovibrio subtropicus]|uniref:alpha/beta fold hydrolase n=1 Tax=Thaumasiovibrio subtropicus TaxID=1891207 RepID=UPI00131A6ECF|nr:alpha/beta hydrolase [Thaumasiovibrio subtropicus]